MNDVNVIVVSGRLTRDMELKYTESGMTIGKFSIASNSSEKKGDNWEEVVTFLDCVLWGKRAESLGEYMAKGTPVTVQGRVKINTYKEKRYFQIVCNNIVLGGKKPAINKPLPNDTTVTKQTDDDVPF